jgi:hypothetical protein
MNLTAERFRKLLQSLEEATAAARPKPDEQRKATRVGVRMVLELQELDGDRLLPPKRAHTRDMSSTGIGFTYYRALEVGRKIVLSFPSSFGEPPLYALYEVKNRRPLGDQLFGIGAVLVEVGYTPPAPPAARPAAKAAAPAKAAPAKAGAAPRPAAAAAGVTASGAGAATATVAAAPPLTEPAPDAPLRAPEQAAATDAPTAEDREALAQRIRSAMFEDD